jgi:ABC-type multidrug transport system fused ATPase/permease subunit
MTALGNDALPRGEQDGSVSIEPCGEARAGCCSKSFFSYIDPIIKKASQKFLEPEDLPDIMDGDKACKHFEAFQVAWEAERKQLGPNGSPQLAQVLRRVYGRDFACAGLVKLGHDTLQYVSPVLMAQLLSFIEDGATAQIWGVPAGLVFGVLLFLTQVIQNFFLNAYFHRVYRIGMQSKSCVISSIFAKSLRVTMTDQEGSSTGTIVNLMSNDATRVAGITTYGHNVWSSPFQIIVAFSLLMHYIGPSCMVGLGVMMLSVPLKNFLARKLGAMRKRVIRATDRRVKLINDVLQGIRIIKLYAWEKSFLKLISAVRGEEMDCMTRKIYVDGINRTMWGMTPLLVAMATFALYASLGGEMKASLIFTALSLFTRIRFPLSMFPTIISMLVDFFVAVDRISKFLNHPEVQGLSLVPRDKHNPSVARVCVLDSASFVYQRAARAAPGKKAVEKVKEQSHKNEKAFTLTDVNLDLRSGELCIVVGKVGSGKTSLVNSILGEMARRSGRVEVTGSIAYVPQSAWILNKTVEKNVILESDMDTTRYEAALGASELVSDLDILPAGDKTEIGEKGINISGGQKQRVALARALYADRDIYILDDPLSALDVHVGKKVFDKMIQQHLSTKLVVLVTHNLALLPAADKVVFMDDGKAVVGTLAELRESSLAFQELLKASLRLEEPESIHEGMEMASSVNSKLEVSSTLVSVKVRNGATDAERAAGAKMTQAEVRTRGSVKRNAIEVYFGSFFRGLPAAFTIAFILLLMAMAEGMQIMTNWWLSQWSTSVELAISGAHDHAYYIGMYGAFTAGAMLINFVAQITTAIGAVAAATRLHDRMLTALLNAPMWWFETTPTGRTLSRCSKDVDEADNLLREAFSTMFRCCIESVSILILVSVLTGGWLCVGLAPVLVLYYYALQYYRKASRELKRLDSVSKSPVFSHFAETLNGLSSVRAFQCERMFMQKNLVQLDVNHRAYFLSNVANRWLSIRLELIGGTLTLCTCIILVYTSKGTASAALAGLALVYITQMLNVLNWGVRQVSETEVRLNAVERLLEYQGTDFPKEKAEYSDKDPKDSQWPREGEIELCNYSMRYRTGLPLVLRDISAKIPPGSRVGICGRTGSGKSSLFSALFRLVEPASGCIKIDGVDTTSLGLTALRSRIAIIPQDPVMFVGTLRQNLDPFFQYQDEELWDALRLCRMHDVIAQRPDKLEANVSESGHNFSQGERQLICIARALLRKPKILLLDEATASIDMDTDNMVQGMIRQNFTKCTCLTIAHRLNTIADSDLIMVLDDGIISEFDTPANLLKREESAYSEMVAADHS